MLEGATAGWAGSRTGSRASNPRSAVASEPARVTTVPAPTWPMTTPCCERIPAMVETAISTPMMEVFGCFQILAMDFMFLLLGGLRRGSGVEVLKPNCSPKPGRPASAGSGFKHPIWSDWGPNKGDLDSEGCLRGPNDTQFGFIVRIVYDLVNG